MNRELILKNISKHIQLNAEEQNHFMSILQYQKIKKKQLLFREGEVCKFSSFVNSGVLRGYHIDDGGIEHVMSFAPADWWIGDVYSLISQQPGILSIDALEDTELWMLTKAEQEKLYKEIPKFERYFRIIIENSLVSNQQRLLDNLSLTAEERYKKFCKRYPTLINTVPQKDIAAYIGVTPEFFSKMRNNLMRKK